VVPATGNLPADIIHTGRYYKRMMPLFRYV
jgi:hypothetical protein